MRTGFPFSTTHSISIYVSIDNELDLYWLAVVFAVFNLCAIH